MYTPDNVEIISKEKSKYKCYTCFKTFKSKAMMLMHFANIHDSREQNESFSQNEFHEGNKSDNSAENVTYLKEDILEQTTPKIELENEKSDNNDTTDKIDNSEKDNVFERKIQKFRGKDKPKFNCDTCNKTFEAKSVLLMHYANNVHERKKHQKHLSKKVKLKRHTKRLDHESTKKFNCDTCDKTFEEKSVLLMHYANNVHEKQKHLSKKVKLKRHTTKSLVYESTKNQECNICGKLFYYDRHLQNHKIKVHEGSSTKYFKCISCEESFSEKSNLKIHMNMVHEQENLNRSGLKEITSEEKTIPKTDVIDSIVEDKKLAIKDQQKLISKLELRDWEVNEFPKTTEKKIKYNYRDYVSKVQVFQCSRCSFVTDNIFKFRSHERHQKNPVRNCSSCSYKSCSKVGVWNHGKIHDPKYQNRKKQPFKTSKLDFQCFRCDFVTSNPMNFKKHLNNNQISALKFCPLCSYKSCSDRGYLNHVKKHGKDAAKLVQEVPNGNGHVEIEKKGKELSTLQEIKRFPIEIEKKKETIAKPEQEEEKIKAKTGKGLWEEIWECTKKFSRCFGQPFSSQEALKRHFQEVHQNFKCHVCNYPFKKFSNLNEHMKRFHNATSYQCEVCHQYFDFRLDLISHYDNQHENLKTYKCHR